MEKIRAIKGTHDILPQEVSKWQYIEGIIKDICENFGYSEIRVPVFEYTELFCRGVGDTTDVVQKEMYTFSDKGGRSLTLRPEGTAGVVRSLIEHSLYAGALPIKLYYLMTCYRNENPQAGRFREFRQFGIELFGASSPKADAEVISLAVTLLKEVGLQKLSVHINSIGCPECRTQYNHVLKQYLEGKSDSLCGLCKERMQLNPLRVLDCKNEQCGVVADTAPRLWEYICEECKNHFIQVKDQLTGMGIAYEIDYGIVRGLDYYTKTVFEIKSCSLGAQSTVCGGGRYDNLVTQLGGPALPGIGFGLGIERLLLCMEAENVQMPSMRTADIYIATMGEAAQRFATLAVFQLRQKGCSAQMDYMDRSLKAQMKYADKIGAKYTIVIGDNELASGRAEMKNMASGEKEAVALDDFEKWKW